MRPGRAGGLWISIVSETQSFREAYLEDLAGSDLRESANLAMYR